jgi:hypothetical protein
LEPVDESPLPVQSPGNALTFTTVNGYHDDYVFNQGGDRKLGIRRNWGGAIVFFGLHNGSAGMNATNTIDGNDTGREVQIALYDHDRWYQSCAWNASCSTAGTSCPETMTFFGWNPVQGGNRCNHGSGYEDVVLEKGAITLRTRPMFWNPNWDRTDCEESCNSPATDKRPSDVELTQKVRFVRPDVVELSHEPSCHQRTSLRAKHRERIVFGVVVHAGTTAVASLAFEAEERRPRATEQKEHSRDPWRRQQKHSPKIPPTSEHGNSWRRRLRSRRGPSPPSVDHAAVGRMWWMAVAGARRC